MLDFDIYTVEAYILLYIVVSPAKQDFSVLFRKKAKAKYDTNHDGTLSPKRMTHLTSNYSEAPLHCNYCLVSGIVALSFSMLKALGSHISNQSNRKSNTELI